MWFPIVLGIAGTVALCSLSYGAVQERRARQHHFPGVILQTKLGSEAIYRTLRPLSGDRMEVEVIRSPGLVSGTRLILTGQAVREMRTDG